MKPNMAKRLAALEVKAEPPRRWSSIIVEAGQTEDEAKADWEAKHGGPVGDCVIYRVIQSPSEVAHG